ATEQGGHHTYIVDATHLPRPHSVVVSHRVEHVECVTACMHDELDEAVRTCVFEHKGNFGAQAQQQHHCAP
ncbi:MAG: hypothetical protein CMF17_11150, partial [Idiomarinaceae bacterium]|nr:hypothetical protein [Idiomarinaceae bacterium]